MFWEGKKVWHWHFLLRQSITWGTILWENHAENVHQKLVPDPFFGKKAKKAHCTQKIILKVRYFERGL